MPPRQPKQAKPKQVKLFDQPAAEASVEPGNETINIKKLKALVWKSNLEEMQEAVSGIQGDNLTMQAVDSILKAPNTGIAAQYLQQIIQRNS